MHPTNIAIASASYAGQAFLMLGFSLLLLHYFRLYRHPYLRFWSYGALYYGLSTSFNFFFVAGASWLPSIKQYAFFLQPAQSISLYISLAVLCFGVFDIVRQAPPARFWRWVVYISATLLSLISLLLVKTGTASSVASDPTSSFIATKEYIMLSITGLCLTVISVLIWRNTIALLGPRLIAVALGSQGLKNLLLIALFQHFPSYSAQETIWAYQGFFNIISLVVTAMGVTIWLLESVRYQALNAMQQAEFLHRHDALTKLPNRGEFMSKMPLLIDSCRANGRHLTIVMVGLDRFKAINDSLGMRGGDRVLIEISERLRHIQTKSLLTARISGDVFILVFDHLKRLSFMEDLAVNIQTALQKPMIVDAHEVHISCSLGIARYPQHGSRTEGLLSKANIALANAKLATNPDIMMYQRGMDENYTRLADIEPELRRALQQNEFFIQLQPIYSGRNKTLNSFEALIRWQHPSRGLLGPGEFLPYVEQLGMAAEVDNWVLEHCAQLLYRWRQAGERTVPIAVNLSARQFTSKALCTKVRNLLQKYELKASDIELEITENVAVSDINTGLNVLSELQAMGVRVSIDDFGTGYSSLSYLRRLPISRIKIDRSFISEMLENDTNLIIVRTLVQLSHGLKKQVIAEGVETQEQLSALLDMGCDSAQGYLLSPPVDIHLALDVLQQHWQHWGSTKFQLVSDE